jgi:hypothetical protein
MNANRTVKFTRDDQGNRVRIEAAGIDDLSAPVADPIAFFAEAADGWDLEYDDSVGGQITISLPVGG